MPPHDPDPSVPASPAEVSGGMAGLVRAFDWAGTPLGPMAGWSRGLQVVVDLMLAHPQPAAVLWGPELVQVHNDGLATMAGGRPSSLGRPTRECWPGAWHVNGPTCERVLGHGESVLVEDRPLFGPGRDDVGDASFTLSYGPARDDDGRVAGVFVTAVETTAKVRAERDRDRLEAERRRAEAGLRDSEGLFRALVTASSNAVYRMSPDWSEMRRLEGREFLADTTSPDSSWLDVYIPADDRPLVLAAIRAASRARRPFELEHRVRRADGSVGWTLSRAIPMLGGDGEIVEWFGAASDITDRKRTEAALRESEARLRAVASSLPNAAVFVVDPDLRYILAAGQDLESAELAADLEGRTLAEALPPSLAAERAVSYRRALAGESFRVEHADHGRSYVTHGVPLRDPGGAVAAALAVSYDITDRVRAEEGRRQAEGRLRLALAAARMGTWWWDVAGDAHGRDANLNALLGLPAEGTVRPLAEFLGHVHPDDRGRVADAFERTVRLGRPMVVEFRVVRPDGSVRWLRDQGDVFGEGGRARMTGACVDVTELKEVEAALRRSRDELEDRVIERTAELGEALAARRELLGRVVTAQEDERRRVSRDLHDVLGQELAALVLSLGVLGEALPDDAPGRGRLRDVEAIVNRIGREAHDLAFDLRPTVLDDIGVGPALELYAARWSARAGIPCDFLSLGLDGDRLPPGVETAAYRIVQEALTNVAKHAGAAWVSVVIELDWGELLLLVEDDGRGFDTGREAHRRLGLLGMRERLVLIGGALRVDFAPGEGTTIRASLPLDAGPRPTIAGP